MSVVDEILTDAIFPGLPMEELPLVLSEESALFTGDVPAISESLDSGEQPSSATRSSEDLPPVLQCEGEDNSVDGEDGSGVGGSENIEDNNNLRRHDDDDNDHVAALAGFNESSGESGQFLDELDDQVRESVLRTCDEKFLRTLPEKYRTEAMSLRGQVGGVVVQADGTEDDDESDDEGTFEVEKIVDCVIRDDGVKYFLVRWKRYGPSADTWEPEHNMIDCKKLVDEYMHKQQQEEQRLKKNSSKAGEQPATRTSRARANKAGREVAKPSPSKVSSPAGKQDGGRKSRRTAAVKDAAASRRRTQASGGEEDERKNDDVDEEEDSDEEELTSAEGEYQIERILSWRNGAKGREYRVKWLGYPHSQNTWEPEKNIDGCDVFIEYHAKTFPDEHPSDDEDNDNDDGGGDEKKTGRTRSRSRRDIHDIDIDDDDDDDEEVITTAGSSRVINDDDEEEESMRMMAIEKVVDERSSGNGTREYLVKWKGRASSHNSWLPEQQLTGEPALISYQDRRTPARDKRSRSEMARSPMRRPASSSSSSTGNLLEPEASPGSSTLLELVGISEIERCRRDGPDEFSWLVKKKKNQRRGVWLQQSDLAYPLQTWVAMGYLQNYSPSATVQALGLSLSPASGRPVRSLSSAGTPVYCTASNVRPADDSDSIAYCRSCLRHGHVVPFLDLLPSPTMDSIRTHLDIDSSHWHPVAACRPVTAVLSSVSILSKMVAFLPLAAHAKTRVAAFAVDIPPGRDCYALKIDAAYFALVPIDVPVIRIVRSTGLHSQEILVRPKLGCVIFHSSPAEVLLTSPDEGITYHYLLLAFLADDSLSSSLLLSASPLKPAHAITATTVPDFLEEIGLRQYAGLFQENGFDLLDDVFALDDDALAKLGIGLMGHRTRILRFAKQATSNELA